MRKIFNIVLLKTASHNPIFKFITAIFPGLGAVFLIFMKDPVYNATRLAYLYWTKSLTNGTKEFYSIDYLVLFYYILILGWIFFYAVFITNESLSNKQNILNNKEHLEQIRSEIGGAIHNAPNPEVFTDYLLVLSNLLTQLKYLDQNYHSAPDAAEAYSPFFQVFLKNICLLAGKFSKNDPALYSANIMKYYPNDTKNSAYIKELKKDRNKWPYFATVDVDYVRGILVGIDELVYAENVPKPPLIAIPLVQTENRKDIILPGAGKAARDGVSIINITNINNGDQIDLYESAEQENVVKYFQGPGVAIKSVASIAIPVTGIGDYNMNDLQCLAIVNIDCSKEYLLGKEEKYFSTFLALIKPLLALAAPHLTNYFKILEKESQK